MHSPRTSLQSHLICGQQPQQEQWHACEGHILHCVSHARQRLCIRAPYVIFCYTNITLTKSYQSIAYQQQI
jgi:hypothetical protein